MKSKLLFLFLIPTQILFAQTFTEKTGTPFEGVRAASVAFSDVNGDGYDDVLITGENNATLPIAKLYTNNGAGIFSEITPAVFDAVSRSAIAFSDVNGDGYDDVLITGRDTSFESNTQLYTNDGTGHFTKMTNTPFDSVYSGAVAFSDVNGDGHHDLLITGVNQSLKKVAKLYTNDGTGTFTEVTGTPFEGVMHSSIAFSDVNGDTHEEVLMTGINSVGEYTTKLYTNDGTGNFTEVTGTPFPAIAYGAVVFSDVNGDGYRDVLMSGEDSAQTRITKLYTNDGTGTFTEILGTPFDGAFYSSLAFSDINGDGYDDVLLTGVSSSDMIISKLYTNDGTGTFTELPGTPFAIVWFGSLAFSDVNNDGNTDVLIVGGGIGENVAKLYLNNEASSAGDIAAQVSLDLTLSPNPATASTLLLNYNSTEKSDIILKVYTPNGSLLLQQQTNAVTGPQTFSLDISTLSSGTYFLELDNGTQKGVAQFLIR
jgi:hypothetical protein